MPAVKQSDSSRCGRLGMILRQFLHTDPVAISYLFGCGGRAACAVVDPVGDIAPYLRAADNTGMRIHFVIDTHVHADHRSAGRALAARSGRRVRPPRRRRCRFSFPCRQGRRALAARQCRGRRACTRPATRRSISAFWSPIARGRDEPWFVLTGHTLMVGDVGRTELAADAAAGARILFASLVSA